MSLLRMSAIGRVLPDAVLRNVRARRLFARSAILVTAASRAVSVFQQAGPDPFRPFNVRMPQCPFRVKQRVQNRFGGTCFTMAIIFISIQKGD